MSDKAKIAILDGGAYYHHFAINTPAFRPYFDQIIYAPDLPSTSLDAFDVLIVIDRLNPDLLRQHAERLLAFADQGKTLVVLGEVEAHTWLPGAEWVSRPTNFWWWLDKNGDSGLRLAAPNHDLFNYLSLSDAIWHYHGLFLPPAEASKLIVLDETMTGGEADTILYEDRVSTNGRFLVTCLDPFFHHGSNFMPATTRFLSGFLAWLSQTKN